MNRSETVSERIHRTLHSVAFPNLRIAVPSFANVHTDDQCDPEPTRRHLLAQYQNDLITLMRDETNARC